MRRTRWPRVVVRAVIRQAFDLHRRSLSSRRSRRKMSAAYSRRDVIVPSMIHMGWRAVLLLMLASRLTAIGHAQSFEVASVKRHLSADEARVRFEMPRGRLVVVNAPLRFVIRQAYRVPEARIIGGPAWIDDERFDIQAAGADANADTIRLMLRTLLKDRFGLAMRAESREMP